MLTSLPTLWGRRVTIRRDYVDSRFGQLHYAEAGEGEALLFLHQSPRSWTEYLAVLPLAAIDRRAIAMDTVGYGASAKPASPPQSIAMFADGVTDLIDALDLRVVHLVGHHTGSVIAMEVAARGDQRIASLVLSAPVYVDESDRAAYPYSPPIDWVQQESTGQHLKHLWSRRRRFYAPGQEQALTRYVIDALAVIDHLEDGHIAVHSYRMEERVAAVTVPTLVLCGAEDQAAMHGSVRVATQLACPMTVIPGAGVTMPEQRPDAFADAVRAFTAKHIVG